MGLARNASGARSNQQELAIDLSHLVGKLPADGYLILTDMPDGARLSHGHDNGDKTWTVFCDEIPGLKFLPGDMRGIVSLNALIFSLDPGANRAARQLPMVLHTDDAVEWTDPPPVGPDKHGMTCPSTSANGEATSNPGAVLSAPSGVDPAGTLAQPGPKQSHREGPISTEPNKSHQNGVSTHLTDGVAERKSEESDARTGGPLSALFADAGQRWAVEFDHLFSQSLTELRYEAERAVLELEQRHAAEMKELTEAVRTQHGIIAALELSNRRAKDEAAAQLSAAEASWHHGEADRMKAAQEKWARQEDALNREIERHRAAAEQLETALLALKEQSVAKERDAQDQLEHLKKDAERMLRTARSDWQREVAKRLESAGIQILAVFDTAATSQ
jgi:hypothetical protein